MIKRIAIVFFILFSAKLFSASFAPFLEQVYQSEYGVFRNTETSGIFTSSLFSEGEIPDSLMVYGMGDPDEITRLGGSLYISGNDLFTASIPLDELESFRNSDEISHLFLAGPARSTMNKVNATINSGISYSAGYSGSDVLVGIIDSGIDLEHPDFLNENGLSRIYSIWDQTVTGGTPPAGFDFGHEWSKSQIDRGLCGEVDIDGHGTHVAGIAAGNGDASDDLYQGVSEGANLVIVKMDFSSVVNAYNGIEYVFRVAEELDMPCVVNLSIGYQAGNHRSDDPLTELGDELVDLYGPEGRIIVWAAGNEGDEPIHAQIDTSTSTNTAVKFYYTRETSGGQNIPLDIYFFIDSDTRVPVRLRTPSAQTSIDWTTSDLSQNSDAALQYYDYPTGQKLVAIAVYADTKIGNWSLEFGTTTTAHEVNGYIIDSEIYGRKFDTAVQDSTLSSTAAQADALTIAATVNRTIFTNYLNTTYVNTNFTEDDLAYFSGRGPTLDGLNKPDISAPGTFVIAPMSGEITVPYYAITEDYMVLSGTSMATPVIAGAVARLLEKDPTLTIDEVRDQLIDYCQGSAYKVSYGPGNWDSGFGYGILDMSFISTEDTVSTPTVDVSVFNNVVNFSGGQDNQFSIKVRSNSERMEQTINVKIYDHSGNLIMDYGTDTINSIEVKEYVWDGIDQFGRNVPAGIYFSVVATDSSIERTPILVVQ